MYILSVFLLQLINLFVDLSQLQDALVHRPAIVLCFSCLVEIFQLVYFVHQLVEPCEFFVSGGHVVIVLKDVGDDTRNQSSNENEHEEH